MSRTPAHIVQSLQMILENKDLIGTYTNRKTCLITPAISVGTVPNNVDVSGLEYVIDTFPQVSGSYLNGCRVHRKMEWCLVVVQHDNLSMKGKSDLYTAVDLILNSLPRSKAQNVPQMSPLKSLPMVKITLILSEGNNFIRY